MFGFHQTNSCELHSFSIYLGSISFFFLYRGSISSLLEKVYTNSYWFPPLNPDKIHNIFPTFSKPKLQQILFVFLSSVQNIIIKFNTNKNCLIQIMIKSIIVLNLFYILQTFITWFLTTKSNCQTFSRSENFKMKYKLFPKFMKTN